MEDSVTDQFPDEVVNFDMSDPAHPAHSAQPPGKVHPELPVLNMRRNAYQDETGLPNMPPHSARASVSRDRRGQSATLPPLFRSSTNLERVGLRRRPKSPTPNYTMINKREPRSARTPPFNALNRVSKPIPRLFDNPVDEREFVKRDMRHWRDEVRKVVPSRPAFAIKSDWQAPPAESDDRDQYIYGPKPVFYQNLKYVTEKDFNINPEWLSEHMTVSVYSQAYRTCALRYGWCS